MFESLRKDTYEFSVGSEQFRAELRVDGDDWIMSVWRNGELVSERSEQPKLSEVYHTRCIDASTARGDVLKVYFGNFSHYRSGCKVLLNERIIWSSANREFLKPGDSPGWLNWLQKWDDNLSDADTPEKRLRDEELKRLRPAFAIDILFAVAFFFIAREFGLVAAAVSGALGALGLVFANRFVNTDLTGGFAVFGAIMALVAAGFSVASQDDVTIKLRGTILGAFGIVVMLIDANLNGKYVGKRLSLVFSGVAKISPRRASFASAGASAAIILIDLPLIFILTTDQWIWYNAFLDLLVSIPILMIAIWLAREK